jgi:hypothetical protein
MATINECHASMGAMIFAFQELEHELVKIYVHLEDPAELEKLSKAPIPFSRVMKNLVKVVEQKLKNKTTKKRLKALVTQAMKFADRRNTFVHSHYDMMSWDCRGVVKFEREKGRFGGKKKEHELQYESFNPNTLYKLASDIGRWMLPVARLHDRINDELHPGWRDEEFEREMELERYYDQMEVPEKIYESFQQLKRHLESGSVHLPALPKSS